MSRSPIALRRVRARASASARCPQTSLTVLATSIALACASAGAWAQQTPAPANTTADAAKKSEDAKEKLESVVVTGSRIKAAGLTSTSPVSQISAEELSLQRAVTVEDFSTKLPQLAGGVNSTSAGSDAFGAQTLDLRNLGQNRTLVLINGTRAVPFSFRNAVDVNAIPAPLLQRVEVLTGGAAAVYGADAISGVVNFIINDKFRGLSANTNYRYADGGASQYGVNLTGGGSFFGRGSVVGYLEFTKREQLLARERSWALPNGIPVAGAGGNFTDVASGRTFSFDAAGRFTNAAQTTDYTPGFILVQPLERLNASMFFKYDFTDSVQGYGRIMFSNVKTTGAPRSGQQPAVINDVFGISSTNQFLTPEIRNQLTFVNGVAQVRVNRSIGEFGPITANNDRDTLQIQMGVRGAVTDAINWDVYAQEGKSSESVLVYGDGVRSRLPGIINSVNIFGPNANFSSLAETFKYGDRERKQTIFAAALTGDTSNMFKLPAGPIGFALGAESRRETADLKYNPNLGQSFRQGVETPPPVPPYFRAREYYAELLVPVLGDLPFVKSLTLEGAYRNSSYNKSVGASNSYSTDKIGASWAMTDDFRLRGTRQTVIREPNIGEFANPVFSIPFANLVTVARLRPRYQGDPCVLGTGNAEQCRRFGAPAVGSYNSLDAANLTGGYFFGGNSEIRAEKGDTKTIGAVLTPRAIPGFSLTLDYYDITIRDAVGQVQPVDALTSCYITDPRADNPLCAAVTRDARTGRILDGFPVDRNLALIKQQGYDIDTVFKHDLPTGMGNKLTWQYQGSIVRKYTIQRNPVLDPIDCKGTYAFRCSSDAVSLVAPDYRHRASVSWQFATLTTQLGWTRIGKVKDSNVGSTDSIPAQDYFALNFSLQPPVKGLTVNFGIDNIADKKPPTPRNAGSFNTYPDTYNVVGRSFGLALTYRIQ